MRVIFLVLIFLFFACAEDESNHLAKLRLELICINTKDVYFQREARVVVYFQNSIYQEKIIRNGELVISLMRNQEYLIQIISKDKGIFNSRVIIGDQDFYEETVKISCLQDCVND